MVDTVDFSFFSSLHSEIKSRHVTIFPHNIRSFEESVNRLNRKFHTHVILPLPINSQFLGIHETRRRGRSRHHGGANASMHARTHLHRRPRVRIASRCIDLMRMPARERKSERDRETSTYTVIVGAAGTRFKGRRTISRYDREPREMYYLFVILAVLASEPRHVGFPRETSLVCYKGIEVEPCLQALHLVCTRDVLAKRIRERYRGRLSCC